MLSKAGDHVPVKPSMEVVGSVSASPSQIGGICVKVERLFGTTTIVRFEGIAHCPISGVNA